MLCSLCGCPELPPPIHAPLNETYAPYGPDLGISTSGFDGSADVAVDADVATLDPCTLSDLDGDGFGTDTSCIALDCDESNPSIHPASAEACNGNDDDCDGEIDEGMPSITCGLGVCENTVLSCFDGEL